MRWLLVLALIAGCRNSPGGGGDDEPGIDSGEPTGNGQVFEPVVTRVSVEIDFESGEAPFTGPILGFGDTFDLTLANVDRLFAGKKTLTIPTTIDEMEDVGVIADEELTVEDLLALAQQHRDQADAAGTKTYYVLFVGGFFTDATGPRQGVLGISLGTTGVIVLFKDVIQSTNIPALPNVVRFVEQSTLIH